METPCFNSGWLVIPVAISLFCALACGSDAASVEESVRDPAGPRTTEARLCGQVDGREVYLLFQEEMGGVDCATVRGAAARLPEFIRHVSGEEGLTASQVDAVESVLSDMVGYRHYFRVSPAQNNGSRSLEVVSVCPAVTVDDASQDVFGGSFRGTCRWKSWYQIRSGRYELLHIVGELLPHERVFPEGTSEILEGVEVP